MTIPAIDQMTVPQSGKEVLINQLFDALRGFFTLQKQASASVGLTLVFYGGRFKGTDLANQSLTLPASTTSYIEANLTTGALSQNTSSFSAAGTTIRLGIAVTSSTGLVSYVAEVSALAAVAAAATSPLTTKGDLLGFDTVPDRVPVGTDGYVLYADSSQPAGVRWGTSGGGGGGGGVGFPPFASITSSAKEATSARGVWQDTALTLTITPTSTTAKIQVRADGCASNATSGYATFFRLVQVQGSTTTAIGVGATVAGQVSAGCSLFVPDVNQLPPFSLSAVDTPGVTSAVTYKLQFQCDARAGTAYLNRSGSDAAGGTGYETNSSTRLTAQQVTS